MNLDDVVDIATAKYKNHPSIITIKVKSKLTKNLNLVMLTC